MNVQERQRTRRSYGARICCQTHMADLGQQTPWPPRGTGSAALHPHYNSRPFPRSLLPLETDVASATPICHHNEVQTTQLLPLLGYTCTTATGRVGLQHLTFWLLSLSGVPLPKIRGFPDIGRRFQCSVARKKDIGPLWWLSPHKWSGQTRPLGRNSV